MGDAKFLTAAFVEPPDFYDDDDNIDEGALNSSNLWWRAYCFKLTAPLMVTGVIISTDDNYDSRISVIPADLNAQGEPVPRSKSEELIYKEKSQTGIEEIMLDEPVLLEEGQHYLIAVTSRQSQGSSDVRHLKFYSRHSLDTERLVDNYPWLDDWFGDPQYAEQGAPWRWNGAEDEEFYGQDPRSPLERPILIGFYYAVPHDPPEGVETKHYDIKEQLDGGDRYNVVIHGHVEKSGYEEDPDFGEIEPTRLYFRVGEESDLGDATWYSAEPKNTEDDYVDFERELEIDSDIYYQAVAVNELTPDGVRGEIKFLEKPPPHDPPVVETKDGEVQHGAAVMNGLLLESGVDEGAFGETELYIKVGSEPDLSDGRWITARPLSTRDDDVEFKANVNIRDFFVDGNGNGGE